MDRQTELCSLQGVSLSPEGVWGGGMYASNIVYEITVRVLILRSASVWIVGVA